MSLRRMGGTFGRMPQARSARLSGAATHPAGARPSKCIIISRPMLGPSGHVFGPFHPDVSSLYVGSDASQQGPKSVRFVALSHTLFGPY
jgi:hypothetical protein